MTSSVVRFRELRLRTLGNHSVQMLHLPKIARWKPKTSITQPWIILFRSDFLQSLNAWDPKCRKSSGSRGQSSRAQCNITCAKIRKIINNSEVGALFFSEFCTDSDHVTLDIPQTFKVNGSAVKVTAWHNISASNKKLRYHKEHSASVVLSWCTLWHFAGEHLWWLID